MASGSGLGLSIARELARLMGGDVRLESGAGTTVFVVDLPGEPVPDGAVSFSRENTPRGPSTSPTPSRLRSPACPRAPGELSHVDASGDVRMVDVGAKPLSRRYARAHARVRMASATTRRLGDLPKGDALGTARLAGIMAAKRTSELIPLCHPLPLTHVDVQLEVRDGAVDIEASASTTAQTGVEMEALMAASVAALTLYDMAKAIDKEMVVEDVRLVEKTKEPA